MKGVLNLYKPRGITSSDAVVACRKILGTRAIGHMGTLDPAGEGVLLLGVGKATRLFEYYLQKDKVYEAEFRFGYSTDTLDGEGKITAKTCGLPDIDAIKRVIPAFIGQQMQVPPMYSAKNINGVRAYKLARNGKMPELPACDVEIYSMEVVRQTGENTYLFHIHCSSGTYIRSICRDLATALGSLATMISIKRLRCGDFCVEDSVTVEELAEHKEEMLVSIEKALAALPKIILPDDMYVPLCNGVKIVDAQSKNEEYVLYCKNELFGIAHTVNGYIKIKTYLRD